MAETQRPSTPPTTARLDQPDVTPEQIRRREEARLKAKALREQRDASNRPQQPSNLAAGQKRPHDATTTAPSTRAHDRNVRDARASHPPGLTDSSSRPLDEIQPARTYLKKYIEYDFASMADTKGGFLSASDDPHNRAMRVDDEKPPGMTQREWETKLLEKRMRQSRTGPYEPNLGHLRSEELRAKGCQDCGSLEIDFTWADVLKTRVCARCKDGNPERYSLLTKSEAREDYLLTEPELKDEELLPRLEKPNPHKSTWQPMLLFLRYQVEEYAFSGRKWGSAEALDAEFERRQVEKKKRKDQKFKDKLKDLKKRTRVEAYRRGTGGGQFGEKIKGGLGEKHEHEWGRVVVNKAGESVKKCTTCGLEVEELEF